MEFKKNHTYLIAELGNIHLHDIDNCRQAISDAFSAGADLVKLQCINPLTAYWATKEQHERYKSIEWPINRWASFLSEVNVLHKDRVFVSTFDSNYVQELQDVMPYWKVAFRMRDDERMISKMVWTGKPIFFSTRGKFYAKDNERFFSRSENFYPLYTTEYTYHPSIEAKILGSFKSGRYSGMSVNFGGKECLSLCKHIGPQCRFIELHVQGHGANGPDSKWSLSMDELEQIRNELV